MKKKDRASAPRKPEAAEPTEHLGRTRPWVRHLFYCLALFFMVYLVYSNSFQSGWVLDNKSIIQQDPRNQEASLENLKLIWTKDYWWPKSDTGGYRPIVSTTYWLNWSVLGNGYHEKESDQVIGFHWVNLLAHSTNAFLVYFLLLKLLHRQGAAFFTAALFAVHPIATEAVTNIIGRADEFAMMSFLGCTLLYIRSTEARGLRRVLWLLSLMLVFHFGLLSKDSTLAFIPVPLAFDAIYRWGTEAYRSNRARKMMVDFLGSLVTLAPVTITLFIRSIVFRDTPIPGYSFLDNPVVRFEWNDAGSLSTNIHNWILGLMTACNVAAKGLWKLIWPSQLSSDYSYDQIPLFQGQLSNIEDIKAILSVLLIGGTLVLAVWCYKRYKPVSFFIFVYWLAYGPTSNFLKTSTAIIADRFLYIPLVAFSALFVLGMEALLGRVGMTLEFDRDSLRKPWPRLAPHAGLMAILALCGIRTYVRNFDWRTDMTLTESSIETAPRSFRGYQRLAFAYYETNPTGKIDRIIELAETGVKILEPLPNTENVSRPYLDLGIYYGMKGEASAARNPDGSVIVNGTTRAWYEKSTQILERGSEIDLAANAAFRDRQLKGGKANVPDVGLPGLYMYLGIAYAGLAMPEKALEAFQYMRHLDPQEPAVYIQISATQLGMGRAEDAAVSLLQGLIVDPRRTDVWPLLVDVYSRINHEPIPAVEITNGRPQLREDNKMVQQHLLSAYRDFLRIARSSERPALRREARDTGVTLHHLNPKLLDDALNEKIIRPRPPSPVFHTYGKKLAAEFPPQNPTLRRTQ